MQFGAQIDNCWALYMSCFPGLEELAARVFLASEHDARLQHYHVLLILFSISIPLNSNQLPGQYPSLYFLNNLSGQLTNDRMDPNKILSCMASSGRILSNRFLYQTIHLILPMQSIV